jgi:FkbM family methyltransferase
VNLGCGWDRRDGYLNVDLHAVHRPDLVADVRDLHMLPDSYYEEVIAQDVLEHLRRDDALPALREWARITKMGGHLWLRVPNLVGLLDLFVRRTGLEDQRLFVQFLFGTQAYEGDYHQNGYTEILLRQALFDAGFDVATITSRDEWLFDATAVRVPSPQKPTIDDCTFMKLEPATGPKSTSLDNDVLTALKRAENVAELGPDFVVDTRFTATKKVLVRLLRVVTHRQELHNAAVRDAIETLRRWCSELTDERTRAPLGEPSASSGSDPQPTDLASTIDLRDHQLMRAVLAATLRRDAHVIDIGAHRGSVLREMIDRAPSGRYLAFEPLPEYAAWLRAQFAEVEVRQAALSDETGESSFAYVVDLPGYSGLRQRSLPAGAHDVRKITVRTERLDDVLPDGFEPDFIKIDVEGAELQVLRGARQTLRRFQPIVVFEHGIGASEYYGTTSAELHELLTEDCDLRVYDITGNGPLGREEFEALFSAPIWNFLARP